MNQFYVTLPSDSSRKYYPENTIAHFRTKLSHRIDLENDKWFVGISEISIPPNVPNSHFVTPSSRDDRSRKKVDVVLESPSTDNRTRNEEGIVRGDPGGPGDMEEVKVKLYDGSFFIIPPGLYDSIGKAFLAPYLERDQNVRKEIRDALLKATLRLPLIDNPNGLKNRTSTTGVRIITEHVQYTLIPGVYNSFRDLFTKTLSEFSDSSQIYIQQDMFAVTHPLPSVKRQPIVKQNMGTDGSSKEGPTLNTSRRVKRSSSSSIARLPAHIYVYTDIIKAQLVGDSLSRLLRIMNTGVGSYQTFHPIYYCPVEKNNIENIEILMTDKLGDPVPFTASIESSIIVLHFIKS